MSKRIIDLTGHKFGRLTVIELVGTDKHRTALWRCQCDCGNDIIVRSTNLKNGNTSSCGCIRANDLTGKRFGRLVVIDKCPVEYTKSGNTVFKWKCQCDCGNVVNAVHSNLVKGATTSCGCYQKELVSEKFSKHGKRNTRLYETYYNIKSRCYNKNNKRYDSYGGRGIKICKEWFEDFMNFYNWSMNNGYCDNLSIDRVDVNGDYCPENCRWVNQEQQSNNQRKTIFIEICGEKKSLKQWTNLMEWKYGKYSARSRRGVEIFSAEELEMIEEKIRKG